MNIRFNDMPEEKLWKALQQYVSFACGGMMVTRQDKLSHYKADFVVQGKDRNGQEVKIDVECDGNEWHEKTAEQAERDKRRDKIFQANGFIVMRFTGSEIVKSPDLCAMQVRAMIAIREDQWLFAIRKRMDALSEKAQRLQRMRVRAKEFVAGPIITGFRCTR